MESINRIITITLALLAVTGCSLQEVQKFAYNSGSAIGCRQENENLPNAKKLDVDCLNKQGDGMSYEKYIELRNEVDSK